MKSNIRKDYLWNTLGVFAQNAISPLLLVVIARLNGINDVGVFSFAFSIAILFSTIGFWGGRTYQVSDVKKEFSYESYIVQRMILSVLMVVIACIFASINGYDSIKTGILIAMVLFKVLETIADPFYGILQAKGYLYIAGKSLLIKFILGIVSFIAIDVITESILFSSIGILAANLVVILAYDLPNVKKINPVKLFQHQFNTYIKAALLIIKRTLPIFTVSFLAAFSLNIPRYFIDRYHPDENGFFGIIAMPITLITLLITFVLQPNIVGMATLYTNKNFSDFNTLIAKLLGITCIIGILVLAVAYVVGVPILNIIFGIDFSSHKLELMVMLLGGVASAAVAVLVNVLTVMRRLKVQFYTLVFSNVILALGAGYIIANFSLIGAVTVFTITSIIQVTVLYAGYLIMLRRVNYA